MNVITYNVFEPEVKSVVRVKVAAWSPSTTLPTDPSERQVSLKCTILQGFSQEVRVGSFTISFSQIRELFRLGVAVAEELLTPESTDPRLLGCQQTTVKIDRFYTVVC